MVEVTEDRLRLAEAFLQEAVYRSREAQSHASVWKPGVGNCGLGAEAVVDLDLTDRGHELSRELWVEPLPQARLQEVQTILTSWVERQDALDRDRNHFMRDFRNANGFDRTQYTTEQETAYRAGLDGVNDASDVARRAAAVELLGPA